MIDMHCHVLPGIDDGAQTLEDSVALARAAAVAGARTLVATPHVSSRYPNDAQTIAALVGECNERLSDEGIALEIRTGAEIAMTKLATIDAHELPRLGLGGGPWLLIESPFSMVATGLESILAELQRAGHPILLAHPERCPAFQRDPAVLESLVASGAHTSITAGSLVGRFGSTARQFAFRLVRDGLAHNVASDAHDCLRRPPGMATELEQAGLAPLADWLTRAVPTAILDGEVTVPPRPVVDLAHAGAERPWWRQRVDRLKRAS